MHLGELTSCQGSKSLATTLGLVRRCSASDTSNASPSSEPSTSWSFACAQGRSDDDCTGLSLKGSSELMSRMREFLTRMTLLRTGIENETVNPRWPAQSQSASQADRRRPRGKNLHLVPTVEDQPASLYGQRFCLTTANHCEAKLTDDFQPGRCVEPQPTAFKTRPRTGNTLQVQSYACQRSNKVVLVRHRHSMSYAYAATMALTMLQQAEATR
jgi:hypothetical protein